MYLFSRKGAASIDVKKVAVRVVDFWITTIFYNPWQMLTEMSLGSLTKHRMNLGPAK